MLFVNIVLSCLCSSLSKSFQNVLLFTRKYYTVNEFQKLNKTNNLKKFHTNINGLEAKFDILHEFLSNEYVDLDIITITKTSHKNEEFFTKNVSLQGYNEFYIPSNSNKGGIYSYLCKRKL